MADRVSEPEGVNRFLYNNLRDSGVAEAFRLGEFDESRDDAVWAFLASTGFNDRKKHAMDIMNSTLAYHSKAEPFFRVLEHISRIEEGTQKFNPFLRDHICHSVYVYLLGIVFIGKFAAAENRQSVDRGWFAFRWKLASLLHDFGNPPSLLGESMNAYLVATQPRVTEEHTQIRTAFAFEDLESLKPRSGKPNNGLQYIHNRLLEWNVNLNVEQEFSRGLDDCKIDHGVLGGLLVLKSIDALYSASNPNDMSDQDLARTHGTDGNLVGWGREHFDEEIVDACTAISIHNLIAESNIQIRYEDAPLAFLLILCDAIQEWDRYSPGQRVYDPNSFNIRFQNGLPKITLSLPPRKVNHIRNIVQGKLRIYGNKIHVQRRL